MFDVNRYDKDDLLEVANIVSLVFLLDQDINKEEFVKRLRSSAFVLREIRQEQFEVFKKWLKAIVKPRLDENSQREVDEILDKSKQEEVDNMVSNLGRTLDKIKRDAIREGKAQGRVEGKDEGKAEGRVEGKAEGKVEAKFEIAKNMLVAGMDIITVARLTGLTENEVKGLVEN